MKILAGLVLKGKKPMQALARMATSIGIVYSPVMTEQMRLQMRSVTEEIAETPQASPSRPSIRLTALVSITIQKIVTTTETGPENSMSVPKKVNELIVIPQATGMTAQTICPRSFIHGLS